MGLALTILARCLAADREIEELQFGYELECETATGAGHQLTVTGDRRAGGTHSEKVAKAGCAMAGCSKEIDARKERRTAEVIAVARMLKRLPMAQGKVMQLYYLKRLPLSVVAKRTGYSYGYVRELKTRGTDRLGAIPDEEIRRMLPENYPETLPAQPGRGQM